MKRNLFLLSIVFLVSGLCFAEKNVLNIEYVDLFESKDAEFANDVSKWNFNFRKYGSATGVLWSDPTLQRSAVLGEQFADGQNPTAIRLTCNEKGFSMYVLCVEPRMSTALSYTNAFPSPFLEFFFTPGDTDNIGKIEHYYQMYYSGTDLSEFPWLVEDQRFRPCLPFTTYTQYDLKNAILMKFNFGWEPLFDRLPIFSTKADNFWRLSVIRWAAGGGQTWGGVVHQANQAGYIRWPNFTAKQKTAMMKNVLQSGWKKYHALSFSPIYKVNDGWNGIPLDDAEYRRSELKDKKVSYINYNEDPDFRPTLEKLIAERNALAPTIGKLELLTFDEQVEFYHKASEMLFNFEYAVEAAYENYQEDKVFAE